MARKKRAQQLLNITEAAEVYHLHRWQIRDLCRKHHLQPQPNPSDTDRRKKWFPRDLLDAYVRHDYTLPLAS